MYKCQTCGRETEGQVNSRGQNRCTLCAAILPVDSRIPAKVEPPPVKKAEPVISTLRGKAKGK